MRTEGTKMTSSELVLTSEGGIEKKALIRILPSTKRTEWTSISKNDNVSVRRIFRNATFKFMIITDCIEH